MKKLHNSQTVVYLQSSKVTTMKSGEILSPLPFTVNSLSERQIAHTTHANITHTQHA